VIKSIVQPVCLDQGQTLLFVFMRVYVCECVCEGVCVCMCV